MIVFQHSFTWIDKQRQSSDQSSVKLQFWHSAPSKWGNLACQKSKFIANDQFLVITSNRTLPNKQNRLQDNSRCALWRPQYTKYCTSFLPPKSTQKKVSLQKFHFLANWLSQIIKLLVQNYSLQKFKKHINVEDCPHLFGGERMRNFRIHIQIQI